ncbi:MAG: phosphoenolpyruvate hydrolase family protein [Thermomicrobiales bacterium]|nr:phosphoenolpyruvate hydrolase family protein [Thermomicrobiales bacterium]
MRHTRAQVLERLREQVRQGQPIIGAGAGTGLSAKFAEAGGADLIIIYNSGRFRMAGHGSLAGLLAFGDANAIVLEMGERDVLPVVKDTPVIAGVMGTDPMRQMPHLLRQLDQLGFSGINNFPTVGLIDGRFRMELERTNMGFAKEVAMIGQAHAHGFFTAVYVFNPDEARAMAEVGADCLIAHMGLTVGGSIGLAPEDALTLEEAVPRVQAIGDAAWRVNPDAVLLCHGGPIATPADASYVLARTGAAGFVGASSMERLPVEVAMTATMREFKAIPVSGNGRDPAASPITR